MLAEYIIEQGGVVFGAKFNERWEVVHGYSETVEGLAAFRGSKYVQSRIGDNFIEVKKFLDSERRVLFSGTPCQIAGLKRFLGREYDNLLTVDFICHGVPSPAVWAEYKNEMLRNTPPHCQVSGIQQVSFRSKARGWKLVSLFLKFQAD